MKNKKNKCILIEKTTTKVIEVPRHDKREWFKDDVRAQCFFLNNRKGNSFYLVAHIVHNFHDKNYLVSYHPHPFIHAPFYNI